MSGTEDWTPVPPATGGTDNEEEGEDTTGVSDTQRTTSTSTTSGGGSNTGRTGFHHIGSNDKSWLGAKSEIGAVLGLKMEKLNHKATFEVFREKMCTYILSEFTNPKDILSIIKRMTSPHIKKPTALSDTAKDDEIEVYIQQERVKMYVKRETIMNNNEDKLYGLIIGQCSYAIISLLENDVDFPDNDDVCDVIWLLTKLKEITSGLDSKSNKRSNLHNAVSAFYKLYQNNNESDDDFIKRFKAAVETVITAGGKHIFCSPTIMEKAGSVATSVETATEVERYKAICYLKQSDKKRHGDLMDELQNAAYVGRDEYPTTTAGAYDLMARRSGVFSNRPHYQGRGRGRGRGDGGRGRGDGGRGRQGHTFLGGRGGKGGRGESPPEGTTLVQGTDGTAIRIRCYNCQEWGHISLNCPTPQDGRTGTNAVQFGVNFSQANWSIPK